MNPLLSVDQTNIQLPDANRHLLFTVLGAIPAALIFTAVLLYVMHLLVHTEYPVIAPKPGPVIPNVTADFPKKIQIMDEPVPVKPVEQELPPTVRNIEPVDITLEPNILLREPVITAKQPISGVFGAGGQMVPFIRIAPSYPQTAAEKGIEGYVDIMFDVSALGTTENIRIIAYVPSTIFNKSVIKAVKGWKYKPSMVDGTPVKTHDVKDRVRFSMEK